MEKDSSRSINYGSTSHKTNHGAQRTSLDTNKQTTSSDFVLQWGNRKRLRCMKVQVRGESTGPVHKTTVRVDRRVVRTDDKDTSNQPSSANINNNISTTANHNSGYFNLRQRPSPPSPPPPQRILRNSENSSAMRGQSNGGGLRRLASPDKGAHDKRGNNNNHQVHHHENHNNNKSAASSETAHDSKKGGGGGGGGGSSSGGSGEAQPPQPPVWPPKFVIALTNKEKEEDFFAFKGSKLPQRPKKRAKFIQRTLNLVSPGAWLCDLTLERYEVREKKITKKRTSGLKAMGNMDSDSE